MRIVLASSEAVPFAKTGGLADVATGLSKALAEAGHEVTLILPFHRQQLPPDVACTPIENRVLIPIASKRVHADLYRATLPDSRVRVVLIDQPSYFDRPGLYAHQQNDFEDNCERYAFFSRAVLEAARVLDLRPDVVHANDWQTALVPALLNVEYRMQPGFERTASVFTIHNMAFQGRFWRWDMLLTGLDWKYFNFRQMEYYGDLNLLKSGIVFADIVTTVSPTYAREICTPEFGCGLDSVLKERGAALVGILNGVDAATWNPAADPLIAQRYDVGNFVSGKAACKRRLQEQCGLPATPDALLCGMISRMTDQKGFDLIAVRADEILQSDVQFVFLGTGEERYESFVRGLTHRYPHKVAASIGFNEPLAHQIEAGADVFLMPSRFEPCGLNQMYSLIYGTPPIVHRVGGLADSVVDATPENLAEGLATGFVFDRYEADRFAAQIHRARALHQDRDDWNRLVVAGMSRDWSWKRSAAAYLGLYERALASRGAEQ